MSRFDDFVEEFRGDVGVAAVDFTKSLYTSQKGHLTKLHTFAGKRCAKTSVVNIYGSASTDKNGTRVLKLEDYVCIEYESPGAGEGYEYLAPPVYFVATPYSESPAFLTFTIDVKNDAPTTKIRINVFSWNSNGKPLANVKFNWHCCVQHIIHTFS